jgi:hypothetical protein
MGEVFEWLLVGSSVIFVVCFPTFTFSPSSPTTSECGSRKWMEVVGGWDVNNKLSSCCCCCCSTSYHHSLPLPRLHRVMDENVG